MTLNSQTREAINEALYRGEIINAIKLYRNASGQGLKESRDFVLALEQQLRAEFPERFQLAAGRYVIGPAIPIAIVGAIVLAILIAVVLLVIL